MPKVSQSTTVNIPNSTTGELKLGRVTHQDTFLRTDIAPEVLSDAVAKIKSDPLIKKDVTIKAQIVEQLLMLKLVENYMDGFICFQAVIDKLYEISESCDIEIADVTHITVSLAMTLPQAEDSAARVRLLDVIEHIESLQNGRKSYEDYHRNGVIPALSEREQEAYLNELTHYLDYQHFRLLNDSDKKSGYKQYSDIIKTLKQFILEFDTNSLDAEDAYKILVRENMSFKSSPFHRKRTIKDVDDSWVKPVKSINELDCVSNNLPLQYLVDRMMYMDRSILMRTNGERYIEAVNQFLSEVNSACENIKNRLKTIEGKIDNMKARQLEITAQMEKYENDKEVKTPLQRELNDLDSRLKRKLRSKQNWQLQERRFEKMRKKNYAAPPELLNIQFCHGSNIHTLYNLALTDYRLMAFGQLRRLGIVACQGEQDRGISKDGINRDYISGTPLTVAKIAERDYARTFQVNPSLAAHEVLGDIETYSELLDNLERLHCREVTEAEYSLRKVSGLKLVSFLPTFIRNIRVLRSFDQAAHVELFDKLIAMTKRIEAFYEKYNRPKPEAKLPELEYDMIENLKKAITTDIKVPSTKILNPVHIPIIFASDTLLPEDYQDAEIVSHRSLKLGKDIQYLITDEKHINQVKSWLNKHGFGDTVSIYTFADLQAAAAIEKLIAHRIYRVYPDNYLDQLNPRFQQTLEQYHDDNDDNDKIVEITAERMFNIIRHNEGVRQEEKPIPEIIAKQLYDNFKRLSIFTSQAETMSQTPSLSLERSNRALGP